MVGWVGVWVLGLEIQIPYPGYFGFRFVQLEEVAVLYADAQIHQKFNKNVFH